MFTKSKKNLLGLVLLVAIVVAVGTAFTAANTFAGNAGKALGYGTQNVSGAHVTSMAYQLSPDGTTVVGVTFVADGDLAHGSPQEVATVGFTYDNGGGPTVGPNADCDPGSYDNVALATTFQCDVSGLVSPDEVTVSEISATNIAVANR